MKILFITGLDRMKSFGKDDFSMSIGLFVCLLLSFHPKNNNNNKSRSKRLASLFSLSTQNNNNDKRRSKTLTEWTKLCVYNVIFITFIAFSWLIFHTFQSKN